MKKLVLITIAAMLFGCNPMDDTPKSNSSNKLSQEECECRGGEYLETGKSLVGKTMVTHHKCFKDEEELYRVFKDETCERYWELKNEKRYKWSK